MSPTESIQELIATVITERNELRCAINPSGSVPEHHALVALATAQREDSELVDQIETEKDHAEQRLAALRTQVEQRQAEMYDPNGPDGDRTTPYGRGRWAAYAEILALLTREADHE